MVKSIKISGEKLTALRTDVLFLSQEELAAKIGVSKGTVGRLEQKGGGMYRRNFRKLSELAKKTPEELTAIIGGSAEQQAVSEIASDLIGTLPKDQLAELVSLLAAGLTPRSPQTREANSSPGSLAGLALVTPSQHGPIDPEEGTPPEAGERIVDPPKPHGAKKKRRRRERGG